MAEGEDREKAFSEYLSEVRVAVLLSGMFGYLMRHSKAVSPSIKYLKCTSLDDDHCMGVVWVCHVTLLLFCR